MSSGNAKYLLKILNMRFYNIVLTILMKEDVISNLLIINKIFSCFNFVHV